MLSQILQAFRSASAPLCADTLALTLNREPGAVEGMLQELSAMGWIQVTQNESACETCGTRSSCGLSISSSLTYILVAKSAEPIRDPRPSLANNSGDRSA